MTDIDYEKMWKEIIEVVKYDTTKLPYEKSVKEFALETGLTNDVAREYLNKQVKAGKMNARYIWEGKAKYIVYSPITNENI